MSEMVAINLERRLRRTHSSADVSVVRELLDSFGERRDDALPVAFLVGIIQSNDMEFLYSASVFFFSFNFRPFLFEKIEASEFLFTVSTAKDKQKIVKRKDLLGKEDTGVLSLIRYADPW